jgi:hypothetical protein
VFVIYVSKLAFFHDIPYAPWCWNIYQHLPHKWPSHVGKYTIHGAYGYYLSHRWFHTFPIGQFVTDKLAIRVCWFFTW